MDSALFTATSGLIAKQRDLDLVSNNLANSSVPGYRPDASFYQVFNRLAAAGLARGFGKEGREEASNNEVNVSGSFTYSQPGPLLTTGSPLDVGIEGEGWFVVSTKQGERYTRGGSLRLTAQGQLETQNGDPVLGTSGPITLPAGEIAIGDDGAITVAGTSVASLRLAGIASGDLEKEGANLYRLRPGGAVAAADPNTRIRQGTLEGPSVHPVEELVKLVQAQRAFEQHSKAVSLILNEVDRRAVTDIAGQ
jgi:flagellar basal-body rod protein FlgF